MLEQTFDKREERLCVREDKKVAKTEMQVDFAVDCNLLIKVIH